MDRMRSSARRMRRVGRELAGDPVEFLINLPDLVLETPERRAKRLKGGGFMPWPPRPYVALVDWEQRLHEQLRAPWPCPDGDAFRELWDQILGELERRKLPVGRGAFAGWGDGEPGLTRAVWCLVRHQRPETVVETGVARGITSRVVLEALAANGVGRLWSIDLPPPGQPGLHEQIGAAVPDRLHRRWRYVRGSSRRRLRGLLHELGTIDLFIHDSKHTERNLRFELGHAWKALTPGGFLVADDVDLNHGFHAFQADHPEAATLLCLAEPLTPDVGRQEDRGVFALVRAPMSEASASESLPVPPVRAPAPR
ncbi:MAG: class I SAM-dependent methyltransferase [Solirubrobacterales bacterium]|nr:class I SAM-dependent methyltransferase [Solirubrobacterales bacterium]MBV9472132.1 class I SAM-dependent methyltransferase [Solirubrobacterales bacterium]